MKQSSKTPDLAEPIKNDGDMYFWIGTRDYYNSKCREFKSKSFCISIKNSKGRRYIQRMPVTDVKDFVRILHFKASFDSLTTVITDLIETGYRFSSGKQFTKNHKTMFYALLALLIDRGHARKKEVFSPRYEVMFDLADVLEMIDSAPRHARVPLNMMA